MRPQVDRHHGADLLAGHVVALGLAGIRRCAPATQLSSTSLSEQFSALPTALTSSSGIGWHQATFLVPPDLPLSRVGESSGISASAAESLAT